MIADNVLIMADIVKERDETRIHKSKVNLHKNKTRKFPILYNLF
jgi:hypothetical protein